MLISFFISTFIYMMQIFDWILAHTYGISTITPYIQTISSTSLSVFGSAYSVLPASFGALAFFVFMWFNIYLGYFVLRLLLITFITSKLFSLFK